MAHEERNETIRIKILSEINDIEAFTLGRTLDDMLSDKMIQKAVVMSLINIGELSKAFTDNYLASMSKIPWKSIRGFRNIAAHQYGSIEFADVYKTIIDDLPVLKAVLESKAEKNE